MGGRGFGFFRFRKVGKDGGVEVLMVRFNDLLSELGLNDRELSLCFFCFFLRLFWKGMILMVGRLMFKNLIVKIF